MWALQAPHISWFSPERWSNRSSIKSIFSFLCLEADQPEVWGTADYIKRPAENTTFIQRNEQVMNMAVPLLSWSPHQLVPGHMAGATILMGRKVISPTWGMDEGTEESHPSGPQQSLDFHLCCLALKSELSTFGIMESPRGPVTVDQSASDFEQAVKPLCSLSFPISKYVNQRKLSFRKQVYGFSDLIYQEMINNAVYSKCSHVAIYGCDDYSPSWITALPWWRDLPNSMKLWATLCRATQDGWVTVKSSDKWGPLEEEIAAHSSILAIRAPPGEPHKQYEKAKRCDTERWALTGWNVFNMLLGRSGGQLLTAPVRMK